VIRYAGLFALVHLPTATLIGYLVYLRQSGGGNVGGGLGVIPIFVAASVVGWRFARQRKRQFTDKERWLVIGLSMAYLLAFELIAILLRAPVLPPLSIIWWVGVGAVTVGLDFLCIRLLFRYPVRRSMQKYLDRFGADAA
jgi:hypothetical protein